MIAEAALADARNDGNPLLAPFRPGGARSDNPFVNFYWDHCSPGKPAHVPVEYMPLADCLALIASAGGAAVLAHPGQSLRGKERLFPAIMAQGFSGLEAYSSYHSPEDRARWKAEADARGLAATCGSDFHGKTKPAIRMGGHGADAAAMTRCAEGLYNAAGRKMPAE
jgi:predicted metal-dependent phosphoesterase TrpH